MQKHPSLHSEDSDWKFLKITNILNDFCTRNTGNEINIIDIGGGAGKIFSKVANHIRNVHHKKVQKYALDICQKTLEKHKQSNPDLLEVYNQDISKTNIANKKMDLALMIDVLEHISNPVKALREIKRISKYAIFKVPLEDNFYNRFYNFIKRGKPREFAIKNLGHINIYNSSKLLNEIKINIGQIISYEYTNVYNYYINNAYYNGKLPKLDKNLYLLASRIFNCSPEFASSLLTDFLVVFIKCY